MLLRREGAARPEAQLQAAPMLDSVAYCPEEAPLVLRNSVAAKSCMHFIYVRGVCEVAAAAGMAAGALVRSTLEPQWP